MLDLTPVALKGSSCPYLPAGQGWESKLHAWSSSCFFFFFFVAWTEYANSQPYIVYTKSLGSETEAESEDVFWLLVYRVRPMLKLLLVPLNPLRQRGQSGWFDLA